MVMPITWFTQWPRVSREKNREFLNWIARQTCLCGSPGVEHGHEWLVTPSHIRSKRASGIDVGNVVPMCMECHHKYGKMGRTLFEKTYKINLRQLAKDYGEQWSKSQSLET